MGDFGFNISGIEEACAMLDRVPKETVKIAFARALAAAAVPIVAAVRSHAPVHTGEMIAKLKADVLIDSEGKGGKVSINFGKEGHTANFVEYGHRMVTHYQKTVLKGKKKVRVGGHKDVGEVQPKPFLRPAASASGEAAVEAFTEALTEALVSGTDWASVGDTAA